MFFGPGIVRSDNVNSIGFGYLFNSYSSSRNEELSIRAVVSLRSDIPEAVE